LFKLLTDVTQRKIIEHQRCLAEEDKMGYKNINILKTASRKAGMSIYFYRVPYHS